jgi:hypothetical protein
MIVRLVCLLVAATLVGSAASGADAPAGRESTTEEAHSEPTTPENPRNRIDFGMEWFDAADGRSLTGFLNYSWVPLSNHSLAATVLLIGSEYSETEGSGVGDLRLQYSFVPSAKLTASPWVPTSLGMGFGLIIPSGDPEKGTGDDRWVAIPTIGWVVAITKGLSFLPTLQYFDTFREGEAGQELSAANLELGFLYVTPSEFWVNYTPSVFRDFEPVDDTNVDHTLIIGQQFTRILAVSLTLGTVERNQVQGGQIQRGSDRRAGFTLHFVLPW